MAREFTLALPHELTSGARRQLAQRFAHELSDRYGTAIDLVIHAPRNDPRNFHAHLLSTTREVTAQGLGRKAALELSGTERHRRGLSRWSQGKSWLRERWAEHTNQALREAHLQVQVSHQPLATPDPARAPWLPIAAYYMEKQGRHSFLADSVRARHAARVARAALARAGPAAARAPPAASARHWLDRAREHARAARVGLRQQLGEQLRDRSAAIMTPRPHTHTARQQSEPQRERQREASMAAIAIARQAQPAKSSARQPQRDLRLAQQVAAQSRPAPAYTPQPSVAAVQAYRNWQACRESHPPIAAAEAYRNWLEHRERHAEHAKAWQGARARPQSASRAGTARPVDCQRATARPWPRFCPELIGRQTHMNRIGDDDSNDDHDDDADSDEDGGEAFNIRSDHAYLACASSRCCRCRREIEVVAIYCQRGTASQEPLEQFTVFSVWAMEPALAKQLERWPSFRFDAQQGCSPITAHTAARRRTRPPCTMSRISLSLPLTPRARARSGSRPSQGRCSSAATTASRCERKGFKESAGSKSWILLLLVLDSSNL